MRAWWRAFVSNRGRWRNTIAHSLLGERLFGSDLWHLSRRSVAGGAALGLFVAFTPTIPFQMTLVAVGAVFFRVNLPVALVCIFATNPVTAPPIYLWELRLGREILETLGIEGYLARFPITTKGFFRGVMHLLTGSLVVSAAASALGWFGVRWVWHLVVVNRRALSRRRALQRRNRAAGPPSPAE
jgi:hypothetical protein